MRARCGEQRHVDKAEQRAAMDMAAQVGMAPLRDHADARLALLHPHPQGTEQRVEPGRVVQHPALPSRKRRIVLVDEVRCRFAQSVRSASIFLISAIALAGLRPLGQTFAQFMIVWQR